MRFKHYSRIIEFNKKDLEDCYANRQPEKSTKELISEKIASASQNIAFQIEQDYRFTIVKPKRMPKFVFNWIQRMVVCETCGTKVYPYVNEEKI